MMKGLMPAVLAALLTGCVTTSSEPVVGYSGFDNAKTVSVSPNGNACEQIVCTGLGAQWNSSSPKNAIIIVQIFNQYTAITGAEFSIDGKKIQLTQANNITDFETINSTLRESSKGFSAPLSLIKDILTAKKVWLRVYTPTGYIDDLFVGEGKESKAFYALNKFLKKINS